MKNLKLHHASSLLLLFLAVTAWSAADIQTAEGRSEERARISSERAALGQKFDAQDRECQTRFVVTSCRDEVKLQRTRALDELTRQDNVLNIMERKEASARQQKKLDEKNSSQALNDKEIKRQEALAASAKRETEREEKLLEKERKATEKKTSSRIDDKETGKSQSSSEQEKAAKRAAYEAKQQEYAKRIKRRDEGLHDLAEKQKEREREEARKAEKYAKAVEAATAEKLKR